MKCSTAITGLLLALVVSMPAQEGNSLRVLAEVTKGLDGYKSLEHVYEPKDGEEFHVKAWLSEGIFRRVRASQKGDGGVLTRDFYYDKGGNLTYALATLEGEAKDGKPAPLVEEKFDFADGALVRYLGPDRKPVEKTAKNFTDMETALTTMSDDLMERIEGSTAYAGLMGDADGPKAPVGTVFGAGYSDGNFAGTEQGDYLHLDLKQLDGAIETFFVLKKDPSLEPLLKEGGSPKGTKIRVHWTERMENVPEAGEATRMKVCERIEILN